MVSTVYHNDKSIVLCADDYSLSQSVNEGILQLLEHQRLSAVSCMTQSPEWRTDAVNLLSWKGKADIGLHLNFTHSFKSAFAMSLPMIMAKSLLRLLSGRDIQNSIMQQLDAFEDAMGQMPDFIDGHQHVHVFPQIRDFLLAECLKRYGKQKPWIRSVACSTDGGIKAVVLNGMGASVSDQLFRSQGFAGNNAFAGLYDLSPDADYPAKMQAWLGKVPDATLIMCHPASHENQADDHSDARVVEYNYFNSDVWLSELTKNNVQIRKGSEIFVSGNDL